MHTVKNLDNLDIQSDVKLSRLQANEQIINLITDYMRTYTDQRFGQILYNLGVATHSVYHTMPQEGERAQVGYRDIFFEESAETLKKLTIKDGD